MQADLFADIEEIMKGCELPKMKHDIICAYGLTGSGKSTLINYILNNQMNHEKKMGKYFIYKVNNDQRGPKIGNTMVSETRYPSSYIWKNKQQLFDLPGNEDTGGFKLQIYNASLIQKSLKKGLKIKILLVVSIFQLQSGRGLKFFDNIHRLEMLLGNDYANISNSICIVVTKVSKEDNREDVYSILTDSITVNAHLLSKTSYSILEQVIKQEKVFLFRYPDHKNFNKDLNLIRKSLKEIVPYTLEENAKSSISALASQELLKIQQKTVFQYNKNTQILQEKLRNWVNQNVASNDLEYIKQCKKNLHSLKKPLENRRERKFIVRINEEFGFGFSDNQLQNRFFNYLQKVNFCSKFTTKEQTYRQEQFIHLIDGLVERFRLKKEEIAEKLKLQKIQARQQERERKQAENLKKKLQKEQKQKEKQQRQREKEIARQNKRIQKEIKREQMERQRRQRELKEEMNRERQRLGERREKIRIQTEVINQVKRIPQNTMNGLKKAQQNTVNSVKKIIKW